MVSMHVISIPILHSMIINEKNDSIACAHGDGCSIIRVCR